MHHFRANPPSREVPPRPALLPSEGYQRRSQHGNEILDALERHIATAGVAPSTLGRQIANDSRLLLDLRSGRNLGPRAAHRLASFIEHLETSNA